MPLHENTRVVVRVDGYNFIYSNNLFKCPNHPVKLRCSLIVIAGFVILFYNICANSHDLDICNHGVFFIGQPCERVYRNAGKFMLTRPSRTTTTTTTI